MNRHAQRSLAMYVVFNQTILKNHRNEPAAGAPSHATCLCENGSRPCLHGPEEGPAPPPETAHEGSLLLDRKFPWLAGAFAPKQER
jgi:hypothetical protein